MATVPGHPDAGHWPLRKRKARTTALICFSYAIVIMPDILDTLLKLHLFRWKIKVLGTLRACPRLSNQTVVEETWVRGCLSLTGHSASLHRVVLLPLQTSPMDLLGDQHSAGPLYWTHFPKLPLCRKHISHAGLVLFLNLGKFKTKYPHGTTMKIRTPGF